MSENTHQFNFIDEFYKKVDDMNIDWNVKGLIGNNNQVYAIGSDSKLLGRIFEIIAAPVIKKIAEEHGYIVRIPEKQNTYPDFTLMKSEDDTEKIAIDVKTTYKEGSKRLGYTLGSFTSYLRNNTKNIEFPYNQYKDHFVIGFLYDRNADAEEGQITSYENIGLLDFPYYNVEYFVQRKINITGQKKGSGNTDNIGSISLRNLQEFKDANGPFASLPEKLYLHYWRNYPKYTQANKYYIDLSTYFEWLELSIDTETDPEKLEELHDLLNYKQNFLDWESHQ
ncbi:type II restriction endonuclease [Bacillus pumilus]|uniref:type II restriction endonuclease n=1 Tax=Bacillus pumilus TaxID=1408 RepID=UPI0011A0231C|nr:type II restriction endonuclease [Bacillus pumilus]QHQ74604.1 restriction endonuclease [Bacillus pumilus]